MNKTIGIYGDSYANYELARTDRKSWIDYLVELLGTEYEIVNHGKKTSSVFHCREKFLLTNDNNFYNIFIVPASGRFYSSFLEKHIPKEILRNDYWYNTYQGVLTFREDIIRNQHSLLNYQKLLDIANSLKVYYETWIDDDKDRLIDNLVINDLKTKTNNTLFIYVQNTKLQGTGLGDISLWELEQIGSVDRWGEIKGTRFLMDKRKNHLSDENSILLAKKINQALANKQNHICLSTDDFVKPSKDVSFYCYWEDVIQSGVRLNG